MSRRIGRSRKARRANSIETETPPARGSDATATLRWRSHRRVLRGLLLPLAFLSCSRPEPARTRLILAATTSIEDSGLLDVIAAEFAQAHPEIELAPVAVGTGQAIELGRRGDADVLVTHDSVAEMQLVADGVGSERRSVMHNDFVIAGPAADPAGARGRDALAAMRAIASGRHTFVSRGDDSGTHRRELQLWRDAGGKPEGTGWYLEAGVGMGDALVLAAQKNAYILTDRATYLRFTPRLDLSIICENDPPLYNHYGVTVLEGSKRESARIFADWLTSRAGQDVIANFGRAEFGQPLFIPSARTSADTQ